MTNLNYALSLLSRSVAFRNLSSASMHVGLSQPQLSRLIAKLESELGMELLDRRVKRKSSWTPQALQLAELFTQSQRRLETSIRALQTNQRARTAHLGTLEGLSDVAVRLSSALFDKAELKTVFVDVYDRSELEAKFLAGDLDLIINDRLPAQSKPRFKKVLGYQTLNTVESNPRYTLFSSYEYHIRHRQKPPGKEARTLISNSLFVRRLWLDQFGGVGSMPSALFDKPKKGADEVLLIGGDWLDTHIWEALASDLL